MTQKRAVDRPMLLMAAVRMIECLNKVGNDVNFSIVCMASKTEAFARSATGRSSFNN